LTGRIGAPVNPLRDLHLYTCGETGYTDYPVLAAMVHQPEAFELAGVC
jgi:N-ethylmaleimide reductase